MAWLLGKNWMPDGKKMLSCQHTLQMYNQNIETAKTIYMLVTEGEWKNRL